MNNSIYCTKCTATKNASEYWERSGWTPCWVNDLMIQWFHPLVHFPNQISKQRIKQLWIHCIQQAYWKNMSNFLTISTMSCMIYSGNKKTTQMWTAQTQLQSKRRQALSLFLSERKWIAQASNVCQMQQKWIKDDGLGGRFVFHFLFIDFYYFAATAKRWENAIKNIFF